MTKSKAETFIGFAVRARKCKIGVNACKTLKRAKLVIVDGGAGESTKSDAKKLAERFHCPLLTGKKPLESVVFKDNAKVMAITDGALASAIYDNRGEDFIEIV